MSVYRIYKLIPSMITISAFMLGISAIKIAFNGNIEKAVALILVSSLLDLLDGKVARALDATSPFGKELDSLSDLTCFGVATGLVVYSYSPNFNDLIGWLALSCFSIAVMLRLVRFNIDDDTRYTNFFKGVPAPAGSGLAMLPIVIELGSNGVIAFSSLAYSLYIFFISFLLISSVPTLSIKYLNISKAMLPFVAVAITVFLIGILKAPWLTLSIFGILYLLTIPYTVLKFKKQQSSALNENLED